MPRKHRKYLDEEIIVPIHLAIWNHELEKNKQAVTQTKGYYKYDPKTDKAEYIRREGSQTDRVTKHTMSQLEEKHGNTFRFFLAPTMRQLYYVLQKHEINIHEYQKNSDSDLYYLVNTMDNEPVDESQYSEEYLSLYGILDTDYEFYHS